MLEYHLPPKAVLFSSMISYVFCLAVYIIFTLQLVEAQRQLLLNNCNPDLKTLKVICFKNGTCLSDHGVAYCSDDRINKEIESGHSVLIDGNLVLTTGNVALYSVKKFFTVLGTVMSLPDDFSDFDVMTNVSFESLNKSLQENLQARQYQSRFPYCVFPLCVNQTVGKLMAKSRIYTPMQMRQSSEYVPISLRGFESFSPHRFSIRCSPMRYGPAFNRKPRKCYRKY